MENPLIRGNAPILFFLFFFLNRNRIKIDIIEFFLTTKNYHYQRILPISTRTGEGDLLEKKMIRRSRTHRNRRARNVKRVMVIFIL